MSMRIRDRSDNVVKEAIKRCEGDLDRFVDRFADEARKTTPVDSGHNRDSIATFRKGLTANVHTESGYGGWLEIGTSKMAARPYFRPAFERTRSEFRS